MATPQPGIFAIGTRAQHHLQLDVVDDVDPAALRAALRAIRDDATTISGVNVVIGLGAVLCAEVLPGALPHDLESFEPIVGPAPADGEAVVMPADQHDLWLWFHGASADGVFDAARSAAGALTGLALVASEQPCFTYQASRDLTGFEDGTENPSLPEAMVEAVIAPGQPGEGGSVVLLQRWVHDLAGFDLLDPDEQCQVFGRDKATSEELPDDVRSPRAHISRVVIEDEEGDELEVFRRSSSFGGVQEHGLMFLAFSADRARLLRMLERMAGLDADGLTDRLTEFSQSSGGAWYVAPPLEALA